MKKLSCLFLMVVILAGVSVVIDSCKKEEEQDFPEEGFIKEMKGEWFVAYYMDGDYGSFFHYDFNGDSTVRYRDEDYYIGDPFICNLKGIENLQTWTFTESNKQYQLKTEDVCGVINNYDFTYTNYQSYEQMYAPEVYVIYADVKLIGQDTTISFFHFTLNLNTNNPSWSEIEILFEEDHTPRSLLKKKR